MYSITIKADLSPISLNNSHLQLKTGRRIKAKKTIDWINSFTGAALDSRKDIQKLSEMFRDTEHFLQVEYLFFLPKNKILTKKGSIAKRRNDLDNLLKIPNDVLTKLLNIDDSQFCILEPKKLISPDNQYHIVINIHMRSLEELAKISADMAKKYIQY